MAQHVTDYLQWFHFREPPFRLSPDIDFFFPSKAHKQAIEILKYGISRGEGFMVLSGQAGTGKTMLLRLLLRDLPEEKQAAFIVTPAVSPRGLLTLLLEELDIPITPERRELALLLKDFQEHIIALAKEGKSIVIVIDEAQDLPLETIEQLRLLSNIETRKKKLVQILLVGQPELRSLLADPRLCQLTQRIVINEILAPLGEQETADYVQFRLSRAGVGDLGISKQFFPELHKYTRGLPRLINRAMDRVLLMAAASGSMVLTPSHLHDAMSTLPEPVFQQEIRSYSGARLAAISRNLGFIAMGCGVGAALCFLLFSGNILHRTEGPLPVKAEITKADSAMFPVKVSVKSVKIHAQPAKTSHVVTTVKKGHGLMVLEEKGKWFRVQAQNSQGEAFKGWLLKKQVERSFSAINTFSKKEVDCPEGPQRSI